MSWTLFALWIAPVLGIALHERTIHNTNHGYHHGQKAFESMFLGAISLTGILWLLSVEWGSYASIAAMWLLLYQRVK